jgi:hypothetical protein
MHRSFWWSAMIIVAILMVPLGGVFGVPAKPVRAEPLAPSAAPLDDEVILLTSAGQIRVDDPVTPSGYKPATWNSGSVQGWTMVAAGDFNGDGDAEIVATKSNIFQVFDPIIQPGRQQVTYGPTSLTSTINLLATGDFDGDGRDEIAIVHFAGGSSYTLRVYDGGTNATAAEWTNTIQQTYGAPWQDMSAGDINNDGADDLIMVRNIDNRINVYNVKNWGTLAEQSAYASDWYAVAAGNMWAAYTGAEIALTRYGANAQISSLLLLRVVGGALSDLGGSYKYEPEFPSLATGDVNGDGDDEVLMLRNPIIDKTSLQMVNPAGATFPAFQQSTGYVWPYFTIVRMGDMDGDGRDEVVIGKTSEYRIYYTPEANTTYTPYYGSFYAKSSVNNLPNMAVANIDGPGVLAGPVLSVSPLSLSFDVEYQGSSSPQNITINNTGTSEALSWQAQVTTSVPGLTLSSTGGTTSGALGVSIGTTTAAPGSYTGTIRITATSPSGAPVSNSPQDITVKLTIRPITMVVTPKLLSFEVKPFQSSPVASIAITSKGGGSAFAWHAQIQAGGDWLRLSQMSGTSSSNVQVSVDTWVVVPGDYTGTILIVADDSQVVDPRQSVTVQLKVVDGGLIVNPEYVEIWQSLDDSAVTPPVTRTITIARPGIPTDWVAAVASAENVETVRASLASGQYEVTAQGVELDGQTVLTPSWLSFSPEWGVTPTSMKVSVDADALGVYNAIIFIVAKDPTVPNRMREVVVSARVVPEVYQNYLPLVRN